MINLDDTLVIVTADHGHTMSFGGYQTRGSDIRGLVDEPELADDGKPFSILSYAQGKGFGTHLKAIGMYYVISDISYHIICQKKDIISFISYS
jgi:arylsulfatase A-like enzyme